MINIHYDILCGINVFSFFKQLSAKMSDSRREKRSTMQLTNLAYSADFDKFSWMTQKFFLNHQTGSVLGCTA